MQSVWGAPFGAIGTASAWGAYWPSGARYTSPGVDPCWMPNWATLEGRGQVVTGPIAQAYIAGGRSPLLPPVQGVMPGTDRGAQLPVTQPFSLSGWGDALGGMLGDALGALGLRGSGTQKLLTVLLGLGVLSVAWPVLKEVLGMKKRRRKRRR